MVSFGLPLATT